MLGFGNCSNSYHVLYKVFQIVFVPEVSLLICASFSDFTFVSKTEVSGYHF